MRRATKRIDTLPPFSLAGIITQMAMRLKFLIHITIICVAIEGTASAATALVTFDDLPTPIFPEGSPSPIPNDYFGLEWNNFTYFAPSSNVLVRESGYINGTVSPANVAVNDLGNPASLSGSSTFTLNSAYMTAAWRDGLQVEVRGLQGGILKYDHIYTLDTARPTLINFDYLDVDEINFTSWGGVEHGYLGFGTHFAIDNMTINTVPEPSTPLLAVLGSAAFVYYRLRRPTSRATR